MGNVVSHHVLEFFLKENVEYTTQEISPPSDLHSVKIQSLTPKRPDFLQQISSSEVQEWWRRTKCKSHYRSGTCPCKILAYEENIPCNVASSGHPFFCAFLNAYNNHQDITLSPDDVWLTIIIQFSKYVNDNAEELRTMFVDHEGKRKLTVTTANETSESQWNEFFTLIQDEVKHNTKGEIVDVLEAKFTTTGRIEKMLSTIAVMDSFQKYFSYGRCIPKCGINNVHFLGTLEDWKMLVEKLIELKKYGVVGGWSAYVDNLVPILRKFLDTYEGNVGGWRRVV
eukprot:TRINITY_DN20399_c0_g1_i1.p1 TRINITY_DN20399_c0_g1~~TRINITY_DN20399_c0_g1_i1.p1  ORF type:complete len:283 (+),score=35.55 TRINITY_DN20399_c0_g1_i1:40-888(+)